MGMKPVIYTACGAQAGPKFLVTSSRIEAGKKAETILEDNFSDLSVENMAETMEGLTRGIIIPRQKEANAKTGHNMASPIIIGWQPGDFFSGIDKVIRKYPHSSQVQNKFSIERDRGAVFSAINNAFVQSGMSFDDCISACRNVAGDPLKTGHKIEINQEASKAIRELVNIYSNGGKEAQKALNLLREFVFERGQSVVESLKQHAYAKQQPEAIERMKGKNLTDISHGNRFSSVSFSNYGKVAERLFKIADLRKHFADGIRSALELDPKHVLVPKMEGIDARDRPLVNVAGAIAYQDFINKGHMTIDELQAPYA